jgi:hypothetical protein
MKGGIRLYYVTILQELQPPGMQKRVAYWQWFKNICCPKCYHLGHDMVFHEAWAHLLGYVSSQNTCMWAAENPNADHQHVFPSIENGDVVCSVTYLNNWPHSSTQPSTPLPALTFSKNIWIRWVGADTQVIFNTMGQCAACLTKPLK